MDAFAFVGKPMCVLPAALPHLQAFALAGAFGPQAGAPRRGDDSGPRRLGAGVALLPVHGILVHRAAVAAGARWAGLTSTEALAQHIKALGADDTVRTIVLDVDSPGGSVFGVQEAADAVFALRGRKQVVAVANNTAASGAYWIASQADDLVVTPSGMVGSIGVALTWTDRSGQHDRAGVRRSFVTSGRHKAEGFDDGPLTAAHRAHLQAQVDTYGSAFVRAVARGRGRPVDVVRGRAFGQGRMLLAREAVAAGMADSVETLEQVLQRRGVRLPGAIGATGPRLERWLASVTAR